MGKDVHESETEDTRERRKVKSTRKQESEKARGCERKSGEEREFQSATEADRENV